MCKIINMIYNFVIFLSSCRKLAPSAKTSAPGIVGGCLLSRATLGDATFVPYTRTESFGTWRCQKSHHLIQEFGGGATGSETGRDCLLAPKLNIFRMSSRTMFIRTQETPNPNSLKFYPGTQA